MYFNDILAYITNLISHVGIVLDALRDMKLYENLKRCFFCHLEVVLLGFVVSRGGLGLMKQKSR